MIAELGVFSLILALLFSSMLVIIPTMGLWRNQLDWQASARLYVVAQTVCVVLAYGFLTLAFLSNDFTVMYVFNHSSVSLPWFYKWCAVWGGHEGSMLLWVLILSGWMCAVSLCSRSLEATMRVRVLVILGLISTGFLLFLLTVSNPFTRQFQWMVNQGRDLNPLLQDPGFLFHPPMLYMGYVGFSVAFAFAIAALWQGNVSATAARWARPWTLMAWCALTAGITLGSWWAYRELGWGGWWFWDPVENASFMPWLVGTALLHGLIVSEKRAQFHAWTLLLAIIAFSLSLVGTFLVRSGVLTSVHAFAVDPTRGLYILLFLIGIIGGALLLFSVRAPVLSRQSRVYPLSRENILLLNNVLLVVMMLTILTGTVYPLIVDGLGLGKLSVGAPYFNTVVVPLAMPLLFFMGLGIHCGWQRDHWWRLWVSLRWCLISSVSFIFFLCMIANASWSGIMGVGLAVWIVMTTFLLWWHRIKWRGRQGLNLSFLGMVLAHLGVAVTVIGIAVSSSYGKEENFTMMPRHPYSFAQHHIELRQEEALHGPNYHGFRVHFVIQKGQHQVVIYPEKRIYDVGQMAMTESAIDVTAFRDLYVALGEPVSQGGWSVRVYYKPLVRWIWGGGFLMLAGGVLALLNRRFYQRVLPSKRASVLISEKA